MAAVLAVGAKGGAEWAICVVVVSIVANSGSVPDGKAMAMMLSVSLCVASAILSASPGLVINWFIGLMDGLRYVLYFACSLYTLSCMITARISSILFEIFLP